MSSVQHLEVPCKCFIHNAMNVLSEIFLNMRSPVVWNETSKVYKEMVADEGWLEKSTVNLENFNPYLHKVAFMTSVFVVANSD